MSKPQPSLKAYFRLIHRYLRPYWKSYSLALAITVFSGFLLTVQIAALAPAINVFRDKFTEPARHWSELTLKNLGSTLVQWMNLGQDEHLKIIIYSSIGYIIIAGTVGILMLISNYMLVRIRTYIIRDLVSSIHRHLLKLPLSFFNDQKSGDMVSRLSNDSIRAANGIDSSVRGIIQPLAQCLITLVILLKTSPPLTLALVFIGSAHLLSIRFLSRRVQRSALATFTGLGAVSQILFETFQGIRIIKSSAAERYEAQKLNTFIETFRKSINRHRFINLLQGPARLLTDSIILSLLLVLCFISIYSGMMEMEEAALFILLSQRLLKPLARISKQVLSFYSTTGAVMRLEDIFEAQNDMKEGSEDAEPLRQGIEIARVSFSHVPGIPVLQDVSLKIKKGEMVAFVGPSGAGKTTLADLVLRLFDPDQGKIMYDGKDIREFKQRSYRRNFGVVSQECLLFNTTIRENIIYNREADEELLQHAMWMSNAQDFIEQLSDGLDTLVGERGVKLSGGQRQRIGLARAVYNHPSILILDEATSALDSESEQAVQQAMARIIKETTTLVIAHRLSTIIHADQVVVLNKGLVESIGKHQEILESSPTYKKLYSLQFSEPVL